MNNNKSRYAVIDFEKMDTDPTSACSVGVAIIENDKITDTFYSLICPPTRNENYYCCLTHGLCYNDVKDAPKFKEVWEKVDKMIDGSPIIAHNYGTERGIINACSEEFDTNNDYDFICTLALSRKYMPHLQSKSLDLVCEALNYKMGVHHNAKDDAVATAEAFIRIKNKFKLKDEQREQLFARRR